MAPFNFILRSVSLVGKFLIVFFIAKWLSPEELGLYGLLTSTIIFSVYLIGLEFYTFNMREIVLGDQVQRANFIKNQFALHFFMFLLAFPFLLALFYVDMLPFEHAIWLFLLLIFEQISQELYRILVSLSMSLKANIIQGFRGGIWVLALLPVMYFFPQARDLNAIWVGWLIGDLICISIGIFCLRNLGWHSSFKTSVDWNWVKEGIFSSMPFFISAISIIGARTFDRYIIKVFCGDAEVGVYSFFMSAVLAVDGFVYAGVISVLLPKLITSAQDTEKNIYFKKTRNKMGLYSLMVALFISGLGILLIKPLLGFLDKGIYGNHLDLFYLIMGSCIIITIGNIAHFNLYALKLDIQIAITSFSGLILGLILNLILVKRIGLLGAGWAFFCAMLIIAIAKWICVLKFRRIPNRALISAQS